MLTFCAQLHEVHFTTIFLTKQVEFRRLSKNRFFLDSYTQSKVQYSINPVLFQRLTASQYCAWYAFLFNPRPFRPYATSNPRTGMPGIVIFPNIASVSWNSNPIRALNATISSSDNCTNGEVPYNNGPRLIQRPPGRSNRWIVSRYEIRFRAVSMKNKVTIISYWPVCLAKAVVKSPSMSKTEDRSITWSGNVTERWRSAVRAW